VSTPEWTTPEEWDEEFKGAEVFPQQPTMTKEEYEDIFRASFEEWDTQQEWDVPSLDSTPKTIPEIMAYVDETLAEFCRGRSYIEVQALVASLALYILGVMADLSQVEEHDADPLD
jgi:hypothetical protein